MVIGKAPVDFAVELEYLAAQASVELAGGGAGDAVAAVDRDLHGPRKPHIRHDPLQIGFANVGAAMTPGTPRELAGYDAPAQPLHVLARERRSREHHLQPVVLGRVVAARDRDGAAAPQLVRREVGDRGREHADLDDVHAARADAFHQGSGQLGTGEPAVPAHRDFRPAAPGVAVEQLAAERLADEPHAFDGERFADDAADVVGLEDLLGGTFMRERCLGAGLSHSRARAIQCRAQPWLPRKTP